MEISLYFPDVLYAISLFNKYCWLVSSCALAGTCKREIKLNLRKNGHSLLVLQLASFYSLYKLRKEFCGFPDAPH
jgi:hypothetical protein